MNENRSNDPLPAGSRPTSWGTRLKNDENGREGAVPTERIKRPLSGVRAHKLGNQVEKSNKNGRGGETNRKGQTTPLWGHDPQVGEPG